ncbi:hypothetical protein ASG30_18215 [Ramlibacter sp. Leaf400]|nr:hypothetical protein ASG30_18215 [Ramlibacter sp. Leaf400]
MSALQAKAGRLPDGSIGAPSTDENWEVAYPFLKAQAALADGHEYGIEAWHFALAFVVTREEAFAQRAIQFADLMVAGLTSEPIDASPGSPPCVARYPTDLPSTDFANPGRCLAAGQFLYAHLYVKNVALVYDWLHDRLTESQKESYRGYMRTAVDRIWNDRQDGGWALSDPANNYHYGYLVATVLQALATWGEDPAAVRNWNFLVQEKWPAIFAYLKGDGQGGYWHEGTHYGRKSKQDLVEVMLWLRDASVGRKLDLFKAPGLHYADELVRYQLYSMQPDMFSKRGSHGYRGGAAYNASSNPPTLVQVGDLASDAQGPVTTADAALMAMLADGLSGQPAGAMAQHWVRDLSDGVLRTRRARIHEFLFDEPTRAQQDFTSEAVLPTFTASSQWFHSRSDWTANATAVSFFSAKGPQITSHQHRDQNSFVVWHKGWQAADLNNWSGSGLADDTAIHNTLLVNGEGQRTPILDPRFSANDPAYGRIAAVHASAAVPGLRAVIGDAAAAYGTSEDSGVRRTLQRFDRLLVHYKHIVVVGDSVVTSNGAADSVTYMVHSRGDFLATADPRTYVTASPCGESMFGGAGCVDAMAGGRMVHTTVAPQVPVLRGRSNYFGRGSPAIGGFGLELDADGPATVLLNAMSFTDQASPALPTVESIGSTSGFVGTRVVHDGASLLVLLRDDALGAPVPQVVFSVADGGTHALLVSGLVPGRYAITQPGGSVIDAGLVGADGLLSASITTGGQVSVTRLP